MKIFVISLSNAFDRQQYIKSQLDSRNVPFEFISAINGNALSDLEKENQYDNKKAKIYYFKELSAGEIGCALSHRSVYEKIIKENIERAIVLEDDIVLKPDFFKLLEYLNILPVKEYVIKLERLHWGDWGKQSEQRVKPPFFFPFFKSNLNSDYFFGLPFNNPSLTWGYYIDLKAAKKLYSIMPKIFLVADGWYYYRKHIKLRILNKPVITNNDELFESTISDRRINSNRSIINFLLTKAKNTHKKARKIILYIFY